MILVGYNYPEKQSTEKADTEKILMVQVAVRQEPKQA
jgi:hypothetical protein